VTGTAPAVGATAQFTATATLSDSSSRPVTTEATWTSSNTAVATADGGVVKGVSAGQADISAAYQNVMIRSSTGRYGLQAPAVPGLSFSGDGRGCNTVSGQFTITDAVFGTDGSVQRFAASFEQHCDGAGPALRGNVSVGR